jgi:heavy metal translocating P-type ATPase
VNGAVELCAHCRLRLPARPYTEELDGKRLAFCCAGCLTVFRIVGAAGDEGRAGWFLAKLGLAGLLSGNVMLFQSLLYFGSLDALGADVLQTASWIMLILSAAVYLLLGVPMLRVAVSALREKRVVLEALIAFGALAAIGFSAVATVRGSHRLYYDSGTMLLVLVDLGQYFDARARQRATRAIAAPIRAARRRARVLRFGREEEGPPESVRPGEVVLVRAGEEIPVDGRVTEGISDVDESALTGESVPRVVYPDDRVWAGSIACDGALRIEASGQTETLEDRIARWTREALETRGPIEITADRAATVFIPLVALVAVGTLFAWGAGRHLWGTGALAALSVLVVACPCALGIATPIATALGMTRLAGRGTIVRSGAALEQLAAVRTIAFDKTGTLTHGAPEVAAVRRAVGSLREQEDALALAAAVESRVDHPFAKAIVGRAQGLGLDVPAAQGVRAVPGHGASGAVGSVSVLVGTEAFLAAHGVTGEPSPAAPSDTRVMVAIDGRREIELVFCDEVRPEAREALDLLSPMSVSAVILSGDRSESAARLGVSLGISSALGGLAPERKLERTRQLRRSGAVVVVGDGINDAPALGAADVGVAFGEAADLARGTADVVVLRHDLREIPRAIEIARKVRRIVRQNLAWAFGYNIVGIALAAFGLLRPVIAAAAMVGSSLFVVGNSLRLRQSHPVPPASPVPSGGAKAGAPGIAAG